MTSRLLRILHLAAYGLSNKEIAVIQGLSLKTVKNYMHELNQCFNTTSRIAMVIEAMRLGYAPCPHNCHPAGLPQRKPRPRRKV